MNYLKLLAAIKWNKIVASKDSDILQFCMLLHVIMSNRPQMIFCSQC